MLVFCLSVSVSLFLCFSVSVSLFLNHIPHKMLVFCFCFFPSPIPSVVQRYLFLFLFICFSVFLFLFLCVSIIFLLFLMLLLLPHPICGAVIHQSVALLTPQQARLSISRVDWSVVLLTRSHDLYSNTKVNCHRIVIWRPAYYWQVKQDYSF